MTRKQIWTMALAMFAGLVISAPVFAQGGGPGGGGGQRGQGFDFRAARTQGIRDALTVSDEEWTVLEPKITKIQTLQEDAGGGMSGMMGMVRGMMGRRGGAGGGRAFNIPGGTGESNEMSTAVQMLEEAMNNPASTESLIRQRLEAVRMLRAKAKEALAKAREELIPLLTQRQEATLFQMGLLE